MSLMVRKSFNAWIPVEVWSGSLGCEISAAGNESTELLPQQSQRNRRAQNTAFVLSAELSPASVCSSPYLESRGSLATLNGGYSV
ncbi:MAG: hypothetical protein ACJARU_002160 [Congregibacter sp.]|jgi:hypothetical protein